MIGEGESVIEKLNAFYTMINKLLSVDIKITQEEKYINLFYSFPNYCNSFAMDIANNITILNIVDVFASLLLEEMRQKNMEG